MKKILLVAMIAALTISNYTFSGIFYDITVKNATDGEIKVTTSYHHSMESVCSPDEFLVPSKGKKTIDAGWCCAGPITIKSTSGQSKGRKTTYIPPSTGGSRACRSFSFIVKNTADGRLIAEKK